MLTREPIIHVAIEAARAAGAIISRSAQRLDKIKIAEKNPNDFVTDVDQRAEREIIQIIRKAYPTHAILSEECGDEAGDDYKWIIDPLDGTRNFIHGFPHFAVSIAVAYRDKLEYGVIYDPMRQELFVAKRGKGAQLNEQRIRVSARRQLSECLLATGFAFRHKKSFDAKLAQALVGNVLAVSGDIRRAGSAALDLAYVACGRLDGFWEFGLHPWDMAAGALLVREAGGIVSDPSGGEDYMQSGNIVTGSPIIIRQLLKSLHQSTDGDR